MRSAQNSPPQVWTIADYEQGLCPMLSVGHTRLEEVETFPPPAEDLAERKSYGDKMQLIRNAVADTILNYPGGPQKWMKDNPGTHAKLAVKGFGEPQVSNTNAITINIPWLTNERLAYKNVVDARPILENELLDAEVIQEIEHKSWREGDPESTYKASIAADDLLPKN